MIIINAIIIALIDMIWLSIIYVTYTKAVVQIQGGSSMQTRMIYAIPVYIALSYLLSHANNVLEAFLIGLATYSVYDFTLLSLFKEYPLYLALCDTLWGGILLAGAHCLTT
jgi:uncharacterized membrane protein